MCGSIGGENGRVCQHPGQAYVDRSMIAQTDTLAGWRLADRLPAPVVLVVLGALCLEVAACGSPATPVHADRSSAALVEQFKREKVFWRQFEIARQIVARHDPSVLPPLVDGLRQEDRHVRGNVAFIFASLRDPRGFQTITAILRDRSDRPAGQGIPAASGDGRYHASRQIAADRYYAAHLLGDLRDPRAVPILVPLLDDDEVDTVVPWALAQINDPRAIGPLLDALDGEDPSMRVLAIDALESLHAKQAVPRLMSLLDDHRRSTFGARVSVSDAARTAIDELK
ncbi:MAG TPA: HEAT repeat domain-containing protein [Vicinamibacterales bacterium]|nr:HEAT repeat domain-containing protein [Vicinamibacterales bacterium]